MSKKIKEVDFNYDEIISEIKNSSKDTAIYVGTDSVRKRKTVTYVTVIVLHFDGKHGAKIFQDIKVQRNFEKSPKALRMRMMNEVSYAIDASSKIVDHLEDRPFEIHLDINPDPRWASSIVAKQAMGYVMGTFGFEPKLKPNAPVASFAADRYANQTAKRNEQAFEKVA